MAREHVHWKGAPSELQSLGPRFTARVRLLDKIFRQQRPEWALDIGCGRGAVTRILARRTRRIIATEVTREAVQTAAEALSDVANVEIHLLDLFAPAADRPEFSVQRFDLILLSEVLEHLEDDLNALQLIRPLLKDEGVLVITVPREPRMWSVEDELWGHKRRYLRADLVRKLETAGFRAKTVWTWGFPLIKYLVFLQVWRLKRRIRTTQEDPYKPPALPLPLLHVARTLFALITTAEQLFKGLDRGVGYIVVAEPIREAATSSDS